MDFEGENESEISIPFRTFPYLRSRRSKYLGNCMLFCGFLQHCSGRSKTFRIGIESGVMPSCHRSPYQRRCEVEVPLLPSGATYGPHVCKTADFVRLACKVFREFAK
jgi:hypothetical protein